MNKLYNGDCLEVMDGLISEGVKVDTIITDPPYEFDLHGGKVNSGDFCRDLTNKKHINFISNGYNYKDVFDRFLKLCVTPNILIFCSNKQISKTMSFFESKGLSVTLLTWTKTNPIPLCNGKHISDIEFIVYVRGKKAPFNNLLSTIYKLKNTIMATLKGKNRNHPTEKPVPLMEKYINLHSLEDMIVLDPFMGSGSTGVACKNLNRKFIGIELDENYFNIAKERINAE